MVCGHVAFSTQGLTINGDLAKLINIISTVRQQFPESCEFGYEIPSTFPVAGQPLLFF